MCCSELQRVAMCCSESMYTSEGVHIYICTHTCLFTLRKLPPRRNHAYRHPSRPTFAVYIHTHAYICIHVNTYMSIYFRGINSAVVVTPRIHIGARTALCTVASLGGRIAFFWNLRGVTTHVYTYMHIPIYPYTLSR